MKIVAVVPMKLNNTRLPQKNTKPFHNGKPLCHYILSTLLQVEEIDEVYVYCSSEDIQNYIPEGVKYLKRSQTLDTDTTKMNEVLASFAGEVYADMYVMTHTTAPFISASAKTNAPGMPASPSGAASPTSIRPPSASRSATARSARAVSTESRLPR